jgi:hypothetical protein
LCVMRNYIVAPKIQNLDGLKPSSTHSTLYHVFEVVLLVGLTSVERGNSPDWQTSSVLVFHAEIANPGLKASL